MTMTLSDVDLTNLDTFVAGVPHDQFDLIRREQPVYFHPETAGAGFWCITRFDHLHAVSHEWPVFSSEWGITLYETMTEEELAQQRMMMLMMDPPRTRGTGSSSAGRSRRARSARSRSTSTATATRDRRQRRSSAASATSSSTSPPSCRSR